MMQEREREVILIKAAERVMRQSLEQSRSEESRVETSAELTSHDVRCMNASLLVEIINENVAEYCNSGIFECIKGDVGGDEFVRSISEKLNAYIESESIFMELDGSNSALPQQYSVGNEELLHLLRKLEQLNVTLKTLHYHVYALLSCLILKV